ncbi:MAG: hypothetical protein CSA65_02350 [Proteobacteria bacterium]|nr:MAG: hypothetical protein CSA65_02350 [Pseudomonadota bacterium]
METIERAVKEREMVEVVGKEPDHRALGLLPLKLQLEVREAGRGSRRRHYEVEAITAVPIIVAQPRIPPLCAEGLGELD